MNKVYKVIWSKAKNCYVVASELAKSHTKSPKSGVMSRALVAGVLACVLSCGAVMPVYADTFPALYDTDNYSSGGSVSVTGSTASSNAFTNVSNSTNVTVNGDISASNFSVVGSPSDHGQQYIPAGTGTFVCKANNTNVKTVTVSGVGDYYIGGNSYNSISNWSDTITFNERRFASIVDFIHYIDSTSTITSVAPGNTYTVRGSSPYAVSTSSNKNAQSYNGCPYIGGNGGTITVIYDSSGRIYLGGSSGTAGIVGIQDVNGKSLCPTNAVSGSGQPGFLVELVNKGDYYETKTLLAPRGYRPGETEGVGTYTRTYATAGEEISIVGDYSPTLTVSDSSALSVTGSANLEDGKLSVSDNSSVSTTGNLQASNVQLTDSSVSSGGTLSTKALTATRSTVTANKVETTQGDIDASTSDITATESVESAGVVKAKSLNAPRLLGAGSGMSTLGGGLTVSGQVKGVADATDDTDAVNLGQLNTQLASVAKPYIGITGGELENAYGEGAAGSNSIAFGPGAYASDVSVSIGWKAGTTGGLTGNNGDWTVSIGAASNSTADGGVALGHAATVKAESAVSIGENSTASASGAVAIGSSSVANTANTVSVGSSSLKRKIVNVANGTDANDAATYGQVSSAIKGLTVSGQTITYTKVDGTTGTITTQDNNTTYSAGNGVSLSGTTFSAKPYNGITVDSNGIGVKAGTNVTVNSNGVSVTGSGTVASGNTGLISGGTLFTEGRITADGTFAKKANSIATNITALDTAAKNAIKGLSVSGTTITYTKGDGTTGTITTQDNNTTYSAFTGATSSAAGTAGLVKAPAAGDQNKFLRGDGTWAVDNDTKYSAATTSAAGLMSAADKAKLDGIASGANAYTLPAATSSALGGVKIGSNITNSNGTISLTKANVTAALGYTPPTQDTNTTYDNMSASELTTGTATTARSISAKTIADYVTGKVSAETTARTSAVSSEATTRANADTALGTRIDGTIKDLSVSGRTITYTKGDGTTGTITTQDTNTTYSAFTGATASAAGTAGLVKAPAAGDQSKFLRGDGTWAADNNTTYSAGTGLSLSGTTFSVNTNGSIASGNTGVLNGGTVYSEVRPTADGTFAKKANTTAANITALDTAAKNAIKGLSVSGQTITYTKGDGTTGTITTQDTNTTYDNMSATELSTGTATTARSISAKTIADYVTGKVSAETTARASAISSEATTRANADTALGTRIDGTIKDLSVNGRTITYTKGDGTTGTITTQDSNTTYDAMSASELSTGTATTARTVTAKVLGDYVTGKVSAETTARTTAINSEATTRANADTALGTRIDNVITAYESADTGLSNRIGSLSADGNYIKKSATNNVSANLTALDTQLKTTATAVGTETTNRTNADTALSNRIGSVASDGTFIKKSATNDVAANLTALDTAAKNAIKGLSVNGQTITYTKGDGTTGTITTQDNNTTYDNMSASELSTGTATTARSISAKTIADYVTGKVSAETTARTSAISSEATTRANADTALGTRIDNVTSAYQTADTGLSNRIGSLTADGNYIKKAGTKNVSENLSLLDAQLKTTTDGLATEVTNRTNAVSGEATARTNADTALGTRIDNVTSAYQSADTGLSNRIGSVASDGTFIKKSATNNVATNLTALDTAAKNAIKGLSVSGTTITYTKGDGTTGTITTQDNNTTYENMTASELNTGTSTTARSISAKVLSDYVNSRIGDSTVSTGSTGSTAVGDSSVVTGNNSVSVGDNSSVTGTGSVSVGTGSSVEGDSNVSIGNNGSVSGSNSVAIGSDTETTESNTVAVGGGSSATGEGAVSLGAGTSAKGDNSTALGNNSYSANDNSVALGSNAVASASDVVSVGHKAGDTDAEGNVYTTNEYRRIVNVANGVNANDAATVGQMNTAINTAVSEETSARTAADTALGTRIDGTIKGLSVNGRTITYTKGDGTTGTITTQDTTYSAGSGLSLSNGAFSVVTDGQVAQGNTGIVTGNTVYEALEARIGQINVENNAQNTVAVGDNSSVSGDGAVAVGSGSSGSGEGSVAVGDTSSSSGGGSVAVGSNTTAESDNTVAIGTGSTVSGTDSDNSVAIGQQTNVTGSDSVAVGGGSSVTGTDSTALGGNTVVNNDNSVALGSGSNASQDNVVSVGHSATDTDATGTAYGSDLTRRIVNVADGSSASDAATVGQTYVIQNGTNTTVTEAGTNSIGQKIYQMTVTTDGQVAQGNTGIVTGGTVYDALESRIGQITVQNDAQNTVALGDNSSVSGDGAVAVGSGSSGSGEGSVAIGDTSTSSGEGSVAVGTNTTAQSDNTVAIGTGSTVTGTDSDNSVAIGQQTSVTGSDSVALGGGSSVTGSDATAIGGNTVVNNDNSVAIGSGSNASQDNVVSVGHSSTDLDSTGTAYGSDLNRRIVNVADAVDAHDAVTKGQMDALMADRVGTLAANGNYILKDNTASANLVSLDTQLKSAVDSIGALSNNAVAYQSATKDAVVYAGTSGTVLRNVKGGLVNETSMEAVNGSQLYSVKQDITGFASDIRANASNIDALNSSVTAALSSVSASGVLVDTLDSSKADKSLSNLSDAGKRVLKTYAEDAVATYLAEQGLVIPAAPMAMNNGTVSNGNTLSITNAGNGSLHVGEGSYVNGTSSIAIGVGNQVNANNSGAFGDPSIINADASYVLGNDDTINTGATGSFIVGNDGVSDAKGGLLFGSNTKATVEAGDGMALGNRAEVSAKNAIALGSDSIADTENVLSIGNSNLKRKIINVADGDISQNSSEAVTGAQLFATNEKVQQNTEAIEKKAELDASNIDVDKWSEKLATGTVEEGNTGLVNGGTVYEAMNGIANAIVQASPVKTDGENIFVGAEMGGRVISVMNKDGESRVITGVATNPEDASSVANVGYVNAVGESLLKITNSAFQKVDNKVNKVGASAAALANLPTPTFDGDEKWAFAAGVGHYQGETAGAVGAFYKPTDNVIARVSGSFGNGDEMVGAGVAVSLNKGNTPAVSKAQLVRTINAQAGQIQAQAERIQIVEQENAHMRADYEGKIAAQNEEIAQLKAMMTDLAAKVK